MRVLLTGLKQILLIVSRPYGVNRETDLVRRQPPRPIRKPDWKRLVDGRLVVGANIRRLRKALGLTQEGLAEAADLHWTYLGSVERGERNVSVDNISRLACTLDVEIAELFIAPTGAANTRPGHRAALGTRYLRTRFR